MFLSILLGVLLGVYGAYMIRVFEKNKSSKYIVYIRYFIVVSMSILAPLAIYIIRIFEGVGVEGDPPLSYMVAFGCSLLICLFGLLVTINKV